jgi:hypothetical protein
MYIYICKGWAKIDLAFAIMIFPSISPLCYKSEGHGAVSQ